MRPVSSRLGEDAGRREPSIGFVTYSVVGPVRKQPNAFPFVFWVIGGTQRCMEKEVVEAKTRRFQHKMEQLRPTLEDRKKVYEQKKISGRRLKEGVVVVVLGVGGYALFAMHADPPSDVERQEIVASRPESVSARPALSAVQEKPTTTVVVRAPNPPAPAEEPSSPPLHAASVQEAASGSPSVKVLTLAVAPAQALAAEVTPAASEAPPSPPPAQIRIGQSLSCRGVQTRQCSQPQSSFALHEHKLPHVWMVVYSQSVPYTLTHVYYHEGQKYCEVPLAIEHPRTRTWSNVTLRSPVHVGSWKVEIVTEDGDVLDQVAFRVSP